MLLAEASEKIRAGLRERALIIVVGLMGVAYEGRAASTLGPGERLLIIKQDGSILVHRPLGYEPVNWQPPGSKIDVYLVDDYMVVEARRISPQEILRIIFHEIYEVYLFKLSDSAELAMYATEEDMKRAILADPSIIEEGFRPIEDERKVGESGFIDIFGVDGEGNLVVVEIKRRNATAADVKQLINYVDGIERELGKRPRAIIAAPGIQKSAVKDLKVYGVEFKCLTPKKCREVLRKKGGLERFID
ncbi:MAG: endonuclease NucS [Nitrososphaeria archaeon]|nr:endonuclease NucS [Aigarchaeota archaeon]MCX8186994.1 endonuclease NucS [Nitrososphaeria archaeon]MDW8021470.1 endonuclease NucS [Nitrososphaerota archaeon]